jgi:hypothetical protein
LTNIDLCTSWSDIRYAGDIAGVVRARITRSAFVLKNNPVVLLPAVFIEFSLVASLGSELKEYMNVMEFDLLA